MPGLNNYELDIPGTWNARDIGGRAIPAGAQRPLSTGVLIRTAALVAVEPAGIDLLAELNVTTVLDLRGEDEVVRDGPDRVPDSAVIHRLPFGAMGRSSAGGASADMTTMIASLTEGAGPGTMGDEMMKLLYRGFVHDPQAHDSVGEALRTIADATGATIVHCSAGKDRTGWIVALVQAICEVPQAEIMGEYLLSAHAAKLLSEIMPAAPGMDQSVWESFLTVKPEYLTTATTELTATYATLHGYLDTIGVTQEVRSTLRNRFCI